jgi:hypothetical protein
VQHRIPGIRAQQKTVFGEKLGRQRIEMTVEDGRVQNRLPAGIGEDKVLRVRNAAGKRSRVPFSAALMEQCVSEIRAGVNDVGVE